MWFPDWLKGFGRLLWFALVMCKKAFTKQLSLRTQTKQLSVVFSDYIFLDWIVVLSILYPLCIMYPLQMCILIMCIMYNVIV